MFNIYLVTHMPAGVDAVDFKVSVQGAVITINNDVFDFSFMEKGSTMPREFIEKERFAADVECDEDGVINVTLVTPISASATQDEIYPAALLGVESGTVIEIHLPAIDVSQMEVANG